MTENLGYYPDKDRKMWFTRVEKSFKPIRRVFHFSRYVFEPGMRSPVLRNMFSESEVFQTVVIDEILVQVEQNVQTGLCCKSTLV